jgi:hypothetical protein
VSRTVHPDEGFHDHAGTVMVVAWGQFMDHDYTLTATPLGELKLSNHSSLIHQQFAPQSFSILTSLLSFIPLQYLEIIIEDNQICVTLKTSVGCCFGNFHIRDATNFLITRLINLHLSHLV